MTALAARSFLSPFSGDRKASIFRQDHDNENNVRAQPGDASVLLEQDHHDRRGVDQNPIRMSADLLHRFFHQTGDPAIRPQLSDGERQDDQDQKNQEGPPQRTAKPFRLRFSLT